MAGESSTAPIPPHLLNSALIAALASVNPSVLSQALDPQTLFNLQKMMGASSAHHAGAAVSDSSVAGHTHSSVDKGISFFNFSPSIFCALGHIRARAQINMHTHLFTRTRFICNHSCQPLPYVSVLSPIGPRSSRARAALLPNVGAPLLDSDLVADGSEQVLDFSEAPLPSFPAVPASPLIYGFPELAVTNHSSHAAAVVAPLTSAGVSSSMDHAPAPSSTDLSMHKQNIDRQVIFSILIYNHLLITCALHAHIFLHVPFISSHIDAARLQAHRSCLFHACPLFWIMCVLGFIM